MIKMLFLWTLLCSFSYIQFDLWGLLLFRFEYLKASNPDSIPISAKSAVFVDVMVFVAMKLSVTPSFTVTLVVADIVTLMSVGTAPVRGEDVCDIVSVVVVGILVVVSEFVVGLVGMSVVVELGGVSVVGTELVVVELWGVSVEDVGLVVIGEVDVVVGCVNDGIALYDLMKMDFE